MRVSRLFGFEASHVLPRHAGKCSRLHGHSWKVQVSLEGDVDNQSGFVLDFAELKQMVQPIVDRLDHRHLNCFLLYPSSENVAAYFAHEIRARIGFRVFRRLTVQVSETAPTWAVWDSSNPKDMQMLDHPEADAGWRDAMLVAIPIGAEERRARFIELTLTAGEYFKAFERALTEAEQIRFFEDAQSVAVPSA